MIFFAFFLLNLAIIKDHFHCIKTMICSFIIWAVFDRCLKHTFHYGKMVDQISKKFDFRAALAYFVVSAYSLVKRLQGSFKCMWSNLGSAQEYYGEEILTADWHIPELSIDSVKIWSSIYKLPVFVTCG